MRLYKLIIDVVGVGNVSAIVLLSHLMELGHVNRQEIAALAGLAPYNKDSGNVEESVRFMEVENESEGPCLWQLSKQRDSMNTSRTFINDSENRVKHIK